jgi:hypothetical protein
VHRDSVVPSQRVRQPAPREQRPRSATGGRLVERSGVSTGRCAARSWAGAVRPGVAARPPASCCLPAGRCRPVAGRRRPASQRRYPLPVPPQRTEVLLVTGDVLRDVRPGQSAVCTPGRPDRGDVPNGSGSGGRESRAAMTRRTGPGLGGPGRSPVRLRPQRLPAVALAPARAVADALVVVRVPAPAPAPADAHVAATRSRPGSALGRDRDHLPDRARVGADPACPGLARCVDMRS